MQTVERKRKSELSEAELYELKVDKLKCQRPEINYFPHYEPEEVDHGMISVSYEDECCHGKMFVCGLCGIQLREEFCLGCCNKCGKKLGWCCFHEGQWFDRFVPPQAVPEYLKKSLFMCPCCVENVSLTDSSSEDSEDSSRSDESQ